LGPPGTTLGSIKLICVNQKRAELRG
jgi:hypothetical protein